MVGKIIIGVNMHIIYEGINRLTGKLYIGKTKQGLEKRVSQHIKSAKANSKLHLHSSIRMYGASAFTWIVVESHLTDANVDERERYWIQHFKALGYELYNMSDGGEGGANFLGHKHTEATRKIIGNRQPRSEEWKRNNGAQVKARAKAVVLCKDNACIQIDNIVDWSKANGYDYGLIYKMIRGVRKTAYGWSLK